MRILKVNPILKLANSYFIDSPQPSNISYLWNFGSLLGVCLIIQIVTGVTLGMHYTPTIYEAFDSVEHIMRDVNNGWFIRYCHANTASAFFALVYLHMARGLYYGSYRAPRTAVWTVGVIIFLLMIIIGFLGFLHSPKWFTFNNNNNNNITNSINKRKIIQIDTKRLYSTKEPNNIYSEEITNFIKEKNLTPIFVYEDLSIHDIRTRILNETRNLSGIYLILNKTTMDYYIGSASTGKLHARFSNHLFNFNGSRLVKNAVKKYGISCFAFMVLEIIPEVTTKENNKQLLDLEDFYLKSLLPNYNILTEAGSSFGYKHTEISRIKMKAIYSEERRKKIGSLNKGKNISSETKDIMRKAALNRKTIIYSPEGIKNMKKNSKALIVYNLDNTVFGEFNSIIDASKYLGCDQKTIRRALQTPKKILKRRWIVKLA